MFTQGPHISIVKVPYRRVDSLPSPRSPWDADPIADLSIHWYGVTRKRTMSFAHRFGPSTLARTWGTRPCGLEYSSVDTPHQAGIFTEGPHIPIVKERYRRVDS